MHRAVVVVAVTAVVLTLGAVAVNAQGNDVAIETVSPAGGPAGTEVTYALGGTDAAGAEECSVSSAYRLELLAPDGTLAATGGEAVAVPQGVAVGKSAIRLVCYVPDATARRVIQGLCGRFDVTEGSASPAPSGSASIDCPPTPRIALGQSVIAVERAMSEAFNPQLYYPLAR